MQEWTETYSFVFTDDRLIFYRSTLEEREKIKTLLGYYEAVSGQMVNQVKTTFFFSRNTDEQT